MGRDTWQFANGTWGEIHGNSHTHSGAQILPWVEAQPLIHEFVRFMYDKHLVVRFRWTEWQEGRGWYALNDDSKFDRLDVEISLKLLTAVIRNDRFSDGVLVKAFEAGVFPRIIERLLAL